MAFELLQFNDPDQLAKKAASRWLEILERRPPGAPSYAAALSGGRIARRLFAELADLGKSRQTLFRAVHFFWGDERCVPPTDPESNYALARENFLAPAGIPQSQVHRIHGEDPPKAAAAQAEGELRQFVRAPSEDQTVLDLVFLGMGEDGHVASLFPGEPGQLVSSTAVFRAVIGPKPPPHRITLGYAALAAARDVWVLASGPGKERAFRNSLNPSASTPLARVLQSRTQTLVFTDIL